MSYHLRPATPRDVPALTLLAEAQAAARCALDARLPASTQAIPFLSGARKLDDVRLWQDDHASFVAEEDEVLLGAIVLHKVTQDDDDTFASYYPRRFTSIGLLAAQRDAPQMVLMDLLARAQTQATQWQTPILVTQNAGADRLLQDVLRSFGFRSYYHYTLREPTMPESTEAEANAPSAGNLLEQLASTFWRRRAEPTVTTTPPIVRHATKRDLDAVIALGMQSLHYHATCEPTMQLSRREPQKMRGRFEQAFGSGKHSTVLVAEWQRQIVGFYSIYIQTIDETWSPPLFASGRYGLIAEVAVDENFRGRGIGRQLFAAAEAWFHAHEAHRYWLIFLARNPLSSHFWPALGFETVWDVMVREA